MPSPVTHTNTVFGSNCCCVRACRRVAVESSEQRRRGSDIICGTSRAQRDRVMVMERVMVMGRFMFGFIIVMGYRVSHG